MVAIGTCDYCGEYCSEVGLDAVESFELPSGWIPTSAIERHRKWSKRRYQCAGDEGHRGPLHGARGQRLDRCRHCYSPTHDLGNWDATLDHSRCVECMAGVAGPRALRASRRLRPGRGADSSWGPMQLARETVAPALSTEPADRPRAERALRTYLGNSRLPIRWVPSPLALARALQDAFDTLGDQLVLEVEVPAPWSIWGLAPEELRWLADAFAPAGTGIAQTVARAIADKDGTPVARAVAATLMDAGQFEVRSPRVTARIDAGQDAPITDGGFLRMLHELRLSAGPVLLVRDEILVSERPLVARVDAEARLHAESGPAMAWTDGFEVWAWHGVVVPGWVARDPASITPARIDAERNAEVRRVMVGRFGVERLMRHSGGEVIHEDETGRLWRRRVGPVTGPRSWAQSMAWNRAPTHEVVVMVEVVNATPEPDGTFKTYFLRVPPEIRTAREGVAWTFGMQEGRYRPTRES